MYSYNTGLLLDVLKLGNVSIDKSSSFLYYQKFKYFLLTSCAIKY